MKIQVEKLTFGGAGIGRNNGKIVFVRGGLPGDILEVKTTREKSSYAEAEIEEIVKPSPQRTTPICPVFTKCGGCQWQHLAYPYQLKAKEGILRETLERIGGIRNPEIENIVPSPEEYKYRRRITLSACFIKGRYRVGYYEGGSKNLVQIAGCPISSEPIDKTIKRLEDFLSSISTPHYHSLNIHMATDEEFPYITLVSGRDREPKKLKSFLDDLRRSFPRENISVEGEDEREFQFTLLGIKFYSVPSVFVQTNREINEEVLRTMLDWAELDGQEMVLDLYSGVGTFSLHLAKRARQVIGVDLSSRAIRLAKKSAKANAINNVIFYQSPCQSFVNAVSEKEDSFDLIVIDPPRKGANDILPGVASLSPRKLIYLSCDPPTLARDLKLLKNLGYRIMRIRPFDMFPQTYHIETLALLSKI